MWISRTVRIGWLAACAVLLAVACVGLLWGGDLIPQLTRDPAALSDTHPMNGLLSNLGAACELLSAAVFAWTALLLRRRIDLRMARFLIGGVLISTLLWVDDFFMMHDLILPYYLGIPEELSLGAGALFVLTWFYVFRDMYGANRPRLFLVAVFCLVASVASDQLEPILKPAIGEWRFLLEDGIKWLGLAAWLLWHFAFSVNLIRQHLRQRKSETRPIGQR